MPLSQIWCCVAKYRRSCFKNDITVLPLEKKVVCIGNLVVGGAGKSPIVRSLAKLALLNGDTVAILCRGVGRKEILCTQDVYHSQLCDELAEHGLLLKDFGKLFLVQNPDRLNGLKHLSECVPGPVYCLLDDGLQHFGCPRHRDVVVMDVCLNAPQLCLPVGPYREVLDETTLTGTAGEPMFRFWSRGKDFNALKKCVEIFIQKQGAVAQNWLPEQDCYVVSETRFFKVLQSEFSVFHQLVPFEQAVFNQPWVLLTGVAHWMRVAESLQEYFTGECSLVAQSDHGEFPALKLRGIPADVVCVVTAKDFGRWRNHPEFVMLFDRLVVCGLDVVLKNCEGQAFDWRLL